MLKEHVNIYSSASIAFGAVLLSVGMALPYTGLALFINPPTDDLVMNRTASYANFLSNSALFFMAFGGGFMLTGILASVFAIMPSERRKRNVMIFLAILIATISWIAIFNYLLTPFILHSSSSGNAALNAGNSKPATKTNQVNDSGILGLKTEVKISDIGFLTVGDDVPVTITVTNNSNETRFFNLTAWFRPDRLEEKMYQGDWYIEQKMVERHTSQAFEHTFIARFPDLWWLIIDANGFRNDTYHGEMISKDSQVKYYVHPSSDRDTRVLAQASQNIPITTWILVTAAIVSAFAAATFGFYQARVHRNNLRLNAMKQVFDLLSMNPVLKNRRFLYKEYWKCKDEKKPVIFNRSDDIRNKANEVIGAFDKAAVLVYSGLVDREEFFKLYHWMVLSFWVASEADIAVKNKRHSQAGIHFKKLALEYIERLKMMPVIYRDELLDEMPK